MFLLFLALSNSSEEYSYSLEEQLNRTSHVEIRIYGQTFLKNLIIQKKIRHFKKKFDIQKKSTLQKKIQHFKKKFDPSKKNSTLE